MVKSCKIQVYDVVSSFISAYLSYLSNICWPYEHVWVPQRSIAMLDCQGYSYLNNMAIHAFFKSFLLGESYLFINSSWWKFLMVDRQITIFVCLNYHFWCSQITLVWWSKWLNSPNLNQLWSVQPLPPYRNHPPQHAWAISGSGGIAPDPVALYCWFYPAW